MRYCFIVSRWLYKAKSYCGYVFLKENKWLVIKLCPFFSLLQALSVFQQFSDSFVTGEWFV